MAASRDPLPFGLEAGLRLEDRKVLLPWGSSRRDLESLGNPSIETKPFYAGGDVRLYWPGALVLGGLSADLRAPIGGGWHQVLTEVYLWPAFLQDVQGEEAAFERCLAELTPRFGRPTRSGRTESSLAAGLHFPWTRWTRGEVTLRLKIHEGMGAFYIPYFEMRLSWRPPKRGRVSS